MNLRCKSVAAVAAITGLLSLAIQSGLAQGVVVTTPETIEAQIPLLQAELAKSPYYQKPGYVDISVTTAPASMVRDMDVPVTMRDGKKLYVNVYRPAGTGPFPVIVGVSWFGKDIFGSEQYQNLVNRSYNKNSMGRFTISEFTPFEAPDPAYWTQHGYAVVHGDIRGIFKSEGDVSVNFPQDAQDFYDVVEWAGGQAWSDGNVGLLGCSYLAYSQWPVAALNPPHLKALIAWEGLSDHYRDNAFNGGIPETVFRVNAYVNGVGSKKNPGAKFVEDYPAMVRAHPLFDENWQMRNAKLENIHVPALIAASWSEQGNHSRGSFEAFKNIASTDKWLYTLGRRQWETYYSPEAEALQLKFFDHFLKNQNNDMLAVPRVRLEVHRSRDVYSVEYADQWPVANTRYVPLYLNAKGNTLQTGKASPVAMASYVSDKGGSTHFDIKFERDTKLVGNLMLKLWLSADEADDMDLFAGIKKLDSQGNEVYFEGFLGDPNNIVSRGWLRVSAREKDEQLSKPWQPFLKHQHILKVKPGTVVPVEMEILPTGAFFEKGSTLRLVVQGRDIIDDPAIRHDDSVNKGVNRIYTGGKYDSYLLIPTLPM